MADNLGDHSESLTDNATAGGNQTPAPATPTPEAAAVEASQVPAPENTTQTPPAQELRYKGADVEGYDRLVEQHRTALENFTGDEETPATIPEPGPVPAEEPTAAAEPEQAPETEPEEVRIPDRIRLGGLSEKSRAKITAATLLAKSEGIEFDDAYARINGGKPAEAAPAVPETQAPVRTVESIAAAIDALKTQKREAATNLDTIKMLELDEQIEQLRDERNELRQQTQQAEVQAQSQFERDVETSKAKAVQFYADSGVEGSAFQQKMIEIADRLEAQENPLVYQADAPWKIAQMAGNELGQAPGSTAKPISRQQPSPSAPLKPQPVSQKAAGRPPATAVLPASGAARTTPPGPPAPAFENIRNLHEYEQVVQKLTA